MRASSFSNSKVIDLLNQYFVPVTADGNYYENSGLVAKEETVAYRRVFEQFYALNDKRKADGKPVLSVGTVHAYVLSSDGKPLDSLHVADAGPEHLIAMLERAIKDLDVPKGKPIVKPVPLSVPPKAKSDDLVLHLTSRYLVARGQEGARKGIDDDFVPLDAILGTEKSGQWNALPSEEWLVLKQADWSKLLPSAAPKVGDAWDLDKDVATQLLTRFYPTTENNNLSKNRIDEQALRATAVSIKDGVVRARLDGSLKMKHAFYPTRDDDNRVDATVIGYIEFDQDKSRIRTLRLITDKATYGTSSQRFGVEVHSVAPKSE